MLLEDRIAHLPLFKRRELARIVRVVFEEFENEQKGKLSEKAKCGRILKIILYGSHARGTWRDDRASGFFSDFDLLVIVNYEHFAEEYDAWEWMRERFTQEGVLRNSPRPDPSIIVHSYADVNDQLARGRPFFADIAREGIVLYEVEGFPLSEIGPFTPEMRQAEAWMHFDGCFPASNSFRIATLALIEHGDLKRAAFMLHQSAEELYHGVRLVLTLYSPKLHNLRKLRRQSEPIAPRLAEAWPRHSRFGRRCFSLLHDAYVKGRYSDKYTITLEELTWLIARVDDLRRIAEEICVDHLGERPPPRGGEGEDE